MTDPPRFAILEDRGVLAVSGPDRVDFLQGLVSNDITKVATGLAVYAAFLTPQGKYLHDFFISEAEDVLLLECELGGLAALQKRLSMYKLRAEVSLADQSQDLAVAAIFGEGSADATLEGIAVYADPRLAKAGVRCILSKGDAETILEKAGFTATDPADYDRLRLSLGLPDASRDLIPEKSILLENGFDELNGIDWNKGCYMGQELTARTKYRGLVKKRLMPVTFDGPPPEPGTPVMQGDKEAGEVRSCQTTEYGGLGLALIRLDALKDAAELIAGGVNVTPRKPDWMAFQD
ncbi:MAG: folate-binding protein [Proteobacteria bacterium]|nr:folate-binding protein [Pseudomonadota bacterium]